MPSFPIPMSPNRLLPVHVRYPVATFATVTPADLDAMHAAITPGPWGAFSGGIIGYAGAPLAGLVIRHGAAPPMYWSDDDAGPTPPMEWEVQAHYGPGVMLAESMDGPDARFVVALVNAYPRLREAAGFGGDAVCILCPEGTTPQDSPLSAILAAAAYGCAIAEGYGDGCIPPTAREMRLAVHALGALVRLVK